MPGLNLFTSNRLEILVGKMAGMMRETPLGPFDPEVVIVQSNGMARWISLETARINRICANMEFPFPKPFIYDLFRRVYGSIESTVLSPELMVWRIMKVLPLLIDQPLFSPVSAYLSSDDSGLKTFQLAEKIAYVYDLYLIFRPDMIQLWDEGKLTSQEGLPHEAWQAELWREINRIGIETIHHAALKDKLIRHLKPDANLPSRISIFGISTLPPYYLSVFQALSTFIDVNLYYLNPCREFWEYAYGPKEIARFSTEDFSEEDQYYESGNSLLASMGVVAREFFSLVLNGVGDTGYELFEEQDAHTLLAAVQSDILNLRERNREDGPAFTVQNTDRSVTIAVCHSPLREIEVLKDTLLGLFDDTPGLNARDVVVMMPDVSVYAPYIQSVFGDGSDVPYTISDTRMGYTSRIADTFMAILSVGENRFKAADVLDILENRAVRDRFGISADALSHIKHWVNESRISWGIDGAYREALGLPGYHENTFGFGTDRMLLGYAFASDELTEPFMDIVPYGDFEGEDAVVLGRFLDYTDSLFRYSDLLKKDASLDIWAERLETLLKTFFIHDDTTEEDIRHVRELVTDQGLKGMAEKTGMDGDLSLDVVRHYLNKRIDTVISDTGYIHHGVTFCTLLPMRSIPFRVVYILGMNDGNYPRQQKAPGFDLMQRTKRLCDSSKRHEDRYLFLESLLSARDYFIVSYIGKSIKDNSDIPPSVLVSELLDYLDRGFLSGTKKPLRDRITVIHRLQPFSDAYFDPNSPLFSYSDENCRAALSVKDKRPEQTPFLEHPLPLPREDAWREITMGTLTDFFTSPARYLLKHRLHVYLDDIKQARPEDAEPFDVDGLQAYLIREELLEHLIAGHESHMGYPVIRGNGVLPHGEWGRACYRQLEHETATFFDSIAPLVENRDTEPGDVHLHLPETGLRIFYRAKAIYPSGQIFFRTAFLTAKDRLNAWLHHLVLNASDLPHDDGWTTRAFGRNDRIALMPVEKQQALDILETLAGLYIQGLSAPLAFSPIAAYAFAQSLFSGRKSDPVAAAYKVWRSSDFNRGEYENPYLQHCFPENIIESDDFRRNAALVFEPFFNHLTPDE